MKRVSLRISLFLIPISLYLQLGHNMSLGLKSIGLTSYFSLKEEEGEKKEKEGGGGEAKEGGKEKKKKEQKKEEKKEQKKERGGGEKEEKKEEEGKEVTQLAKIPLPQKIRHSFLRVLTFFLVNKKMLVIRTSTPAMKYTGRLTGHLNPPLSPSQ